MLAGSAYLSPQTTFANPKERNNGEIFQILLNLFTRRSGEITIDYKRYNESPAEGSARLFWGVGILYFAPKDERAL
jgi:hypothetical protein